MFSESPTSPRADGTTGGGPVAVLPCAEEENDSAAPHPEWFVPIASPGPSPSPPRPASKYGPSPSKLRREPFNSEPGAWDDLQEIGSSLSEAGTAIIGGLLTLLRSVLMRGLGVQSARLQL